MYAGIMVYYATRFGFHSRHERIMSDVHTRRKAMINQRSVFVLSNTSLFVGFLFL